MQLKPQESRLDFVKTQMYCPTLVIVCLMVLGCADRPSTIDVTPDLPHQSAKLTITATQSADLPVIRLLAKSWAIRNQATIIVSDQPNDPNADIAIGLPNDIAAPAQKGELVQLPSDYLRATHPYRWDEIFIGISSRLCTWKSKIVAVPLLGEGLIFVYRSDFFERPGGQAVSPPRTWEDLLALAISMPKNGLAAFPADSITREILFFTLAANLDRLAINRLPAGTVIRDDFFTFQFDMLTGTPRLNKPAFIEAAQMLQDCAKVSVAGTTPAESFNVHGAKFGIMTLRDLSQLDPAIRQKIGVLPLPGTMHIMDDNGNKLPVLGGNINRVPYIGGNMRVGMVRTQCENKAAAWDFLMDAGLPDQQSLDLIAATQWGAGPYRSTHLDARVRPRWLGYGLTTAETDRLISALRENLNIGAQNPRYTLRTPNEAELRAVLKPKLDSIFNQNAPVKPTLDTVNAEWNSIIQKMPAEEWKAVLKTSIGL